MTTEAHTLEQDFQHFMGYTNSDRADEAKLREAYEHGNSRGERRQAAGVTDEVLHAACKAYLDAQPEWKSDFVECMRAALLAVWPVATNPAAQPTAQQRGANERLHTMLVSHRKYLVDDAGLFPRGSCMAEELDTMITLTAQPAERQGEVVAYFAADPANGDFDTHATLADAIADAEKTLGYAQARAGDYGWDDEPPQICYGIVLGGCVEKEGSRRPAPEGSEYTEMVDYRLTDPVHPAAPVGVPDGIYKCSRHTGADCKFCGGSGYRRKCGRTDCAEYGCDGGAFCYVSPAEVTKMLAAAPSAPEGE